MGDFYTSIVPTVKEYPNRHEKAKEILEWLISLDIVEPEKSDCVYNEEGGYAISKGALNYADGTGYVTHRIDEGLGGIFGLEIITEMNCFHPGENFDEEDFEEGEDIAFPESNLGFTFWGWWDIEQELIDQFSERLNCEVKVVEGLL
jgi:hypothetical protein